MHQVCLWANAQLSMKDKEKDESGPLNCLKGVNFLLIVQFQEAFLYYFLYTLLFCIIDCFGHLYSVELHCTLYHSCVDDVWLSHRDRIWLSRWHSVAALFLSGHPSSCLKCCPHFSRPEWPAGTAVFKALTELIHHCGSRTMLTKASVHHVNTSRTTCFSK